jgi:hypothetical protein
MNTVTRIVLLSVLAFALVLAPGIVSAQGYWGGTGTPAVVVQDDTTSLATWKTVIDIGGPGIVYQLLFNSSSNAKDPSLRITVDGKADSVSETSSEELTRFVKLSVTPNGTGADDLIAVGDSTAVDGIRLNLPFKTQFKVEAKTETGAAATTNTKIIYGLNR